MKLDIPRNITEQGLEYLGHLARAVPAGGTIVEVGAMYGSATWVLAKNARPGVKIISIDPWLPGAAKKDIETRFPGTPPLTQEVFWQNVGDCRNVEAIRGNGPEVVRKAKGSVAMFFYNRPTRTIELAEHLKMLSGMLAAGGIAAGNEFSPSSPDMILGACTLGNRWGITPEVIGRVWAMAKPAAGTSETASSVYDLAGPYTDHDLVIRIKRKSGRVVQYSPGSWAGSMDEWRPIVGVNVDWAVPRTDGLTGAYQVLGLGAKASHWAAFGQWAEMNGPIGGLRGHLIGDGSGDLRLAYQVSYLVEKLANRIVIRSSKIFRDGAWVENDGGPKPAGVAALRCFVEMRPDLPNVSPVDIPETAPGLSAFAAE